MLRVASSVCVSCSRMRALAPPSASSSTSAHRLGKSENQLTVSSLDRLSVDVRKIRKAKGWVLAESAAYVSETAALLKDMGADAAAISRIFETHPEAVLCRPEEAAAQRALWASVCPAEQELLSIVERFPASFFAVTQHANQRANILYFQSLRLSRTTIGEMMASAPQSFSRPVEQNQEVIHTLRETYLDLGGGEGDVRVWLQKLLLQNPYVLLRPAQAWRDSVGFLRERGFSTQEVLGLVSNLRASVAELQPAAMQLALAYIQETFSCSEEELKRAVICCPAVLRYSLPTLMGRYQGLMDAGVGAEQVKECPNVLELATQVVLYRIDKLASHGYDVRGGSLSVIAGTKEDFETSYEKLRLGRRRPLFNPVAPL